MWWQGFAQNIVIDKEWRENFRMDKTSKLCDELRPYLTKQSTNMRQVVSIEEQVAMTLYYLADEGRYHKVGNAFGVSRTTVSRAV